LTFSVSSLPVYNGSRLKNAYYPPEVYRPEEGRQAPNGFVAR
jgi:hypothetical protein